MFYGAETQNLLEIVLKMGYLKLMFNSLDGKFTTI